MLMSMWKHWDLCLKDPRFKVLIGPWFHTPIIAEVSRTFPTTTLGGKYPLHHLSNWIVPTRTQQPTHRKPLSLQQHNNSAGSLVNGFTGVRGKEGGWGGGLTSSKSLTCRRNTFRWNEESPWKSVSQPQGLEGPPHRPHTWQLNGQLQWRWAMSMYMFLSKIRFLRNS